MREYSARINVGIGDIFFTKAALDNVKNRYDIINIAPNYSLVDQYRRGDLRYKQFIFDLFGLLFSEHPYRIVIDESLPIKTLYNLKLDGIQLVKPDLRKYLVNTNRFLINPIDYITVSTKVRGINKNNYITNYRKDFINCLDFLSHRYNVFILGERKIGYNDEYLLHGDNIFCIYDDIKDRFQRSSDLTVTELGISSPELSRIKEDCTIMNKAKANICLGIGGNFSLAVSVGRTINFRMVKADPVDFVSEIYKNKENDDVYSTDNFESFLFELNLLGVQ